MVCKLVGAFIEFTIGQVLSHKCDCQGIGGLRRLLLEKLVQSGYLWNIRCRVVPAGELPYFFVVQD